MAELQTQFNKFHEAIKIDFEGNQPLRTKRDLLLDELRAGLKKQYPINTPSFKEFLQGSYDLATGIRPLNGEDYDIDVGLDFKLTTNHVKPVELKTTVFNILNSVAKRKVIIKRPCIRVQYHNAGDIAYHIDLAIYTHGIDFWGNMSNTLFIAKGFPNSLPDNKIWEISEPYQLKELIKSKFTDYSDREQFRRVIRYLKRWKDYNFSSTGTGRPTGIALTACCYYLFTVQKTYNSITQSYRYNDLLALKNIVNGILNTYGFYSRINVFLPVSPKNDLFEKMTTIQMLNFKNMLQTLKSTLDTVSTESQITMACMRLRGVFGGDFPTT
jgi:hypothetical protein